MWRVKSGAAAAAAVADLVRPPYHSTAIAVVVIVGTALLLQLWWKRNLRKLPLPPGNLGWPFVGETLSFIRHTKENRLREFMEERVAKHGEVFKTSLIGDPTVVLASPAGNKLVFSSENKLVHLAWPAAMTSIIGAGSLSSLTGDRAKRIRAAVMTFLRPETLQRYVATSSRTIAGFLDDSWDGRQQVLVFPSMKRLAFSLACQLFMSRHHPEEQHMLEELFATAVKGFLSFPINLPGTRYRKAMAAASTLRGTFQKWIRERRDDMAADRRSSGVGDKEDLLSCLLTFKDEEGKALNDREISENILALLFAGHDTSTIAITMVCKYLAENPDILDDVWREHKEIAARKERAGEGELNWSDIKQMSLSWRVVLETLRLQPPSQGTWRRAIKTFDYSGFTIPKGWKIFWTVHATHKNPKYFEEPHKFDPRRFEGSGPAPYTFVPFGGGPRMCAGIEFARMVTLLLLHHLSLRFSWTLVDPIEGIIVDPLPQPTRGLPICLHPRPHDS